MTTSQWDPAEVAAARELYVERRKYMPAPFGPIDHAADDERMRGAGSDLVLATDSAFPYDFAQRPAGCGVIMFYIGKEGYTPHVWTPAEVAAARATGCKAWPIVTGISRGLATVEDARENARVAIERAAAYGVSKTTPVFMDLEPLALRTNTDAAQAACAAFKADMLAAGFTLPKIYSVDAPFIDWVANWTNVRPTSLPAGKVGVQYGGEISPPGYDLSVFHPSLLGDDEMSATEVAAIEESVKSYHDNLVAIVRKQAEATRDALAPTAQRVTFLQGQRQMIIKLDGHNDTFLQDGMFIRWISSQKDLEQLQTLLKQHQQDPAVHPIAAGQTLSAFGILVGPMPAWVASDYCIGGSAEFTDAQVATLASTLAPLLTAQQSKEFVAALGAAITKGASK